MTPRAREVTAHGTLARVAKAVPGDLHENIVIVGSLAVAYHLLPKRSSVRTKDIDCVITPQLSAVERGAAVATRLLETGWTHRQVGEFTAPGDAETPEDQLPAVRLHPPGEEDWFLELLGEPVSEFQEGRRWHRLVLTNGHYGLPSFPFMRLATHAALPDGSGIRVARPDMMAIAHLLEQKDFPDTEIRGTDLDGRPLKRRNKDLGRVLAIGCLAPAESIDEWPAFWAKGLSECFPKRWKTLACEAGDGMKKLVASDEDFTEAHHHCTTSLLAGRVRTVEGLRLIAERILTFAVEELRSAAEASGPIE